MGKEREAERRDKIRAITRELEAMSDKGIHVAIVTVAAYVSPGSKDAEAVAEHFWQLHNQPKGAWTPEVKYVADADLGEDRLPASSRCASPWVPRREVAETFTWCPDGSGVGLLLLGMPAVSADRRLARLRDRENAGGGDLINCVLERCRDANNASCDRLRLFNGW
jgi:hypothetical protein